MLERLIELSASLNPLIGTYYLKVSAVSHQILHSGRNAQRKGFSLSHYNVFEHGDRTCDILEDN